MAGVSQAAQIVLSAELEMQQTEQVHELLGGLNLSPKPTTVALAASLWAGGATTFGSTLDASFRKTSITLPLANSTACAGGLVAADVALF